VRIFRRRARLRPLDERECYLRLHGGRAADIVVVPAETVAPRPPPEPPPADPAGPTEESPALHLLIAYPRNAGRLTGEQVRRDLLRRMRARAAA
jgi:hypothetical protein